MDWTQLFYQRQNDLTGIYAGDIQDHHIQKVNLIKQHAPTEKNILELGVGGGQVACASALAGYNVTAIELTPSLVTHARNLVAQHYLQNITIINDNFYTLTLNKTFDIITYWDGFGIGTDEEQIKLLGRCASWLNPEGLIIMDVMTPWYWAQASGQSMAFGEAQRRYDFDAEACRMLDSWWHSDSPDNKVTQSLRCYSPTDLQILLKETDLQLVDIIETGGMIDYSTGQYTAHANLHKAMSYVAKIGFKTNTIHPRNTA